MNELLFRNPPIKMAVSKSVFPIPLTTRHKAKHSGETKFILRLSGCLIEQAKVNRSSFLSSEVSLAVSLHVFLYTWNLPRAQVMLWALCKCSLMNDHDVNDQGETSSRRGMTIWLFPQPVWPGSYFPWVEGWAQARLATWGISKELPGQEGRKLQWWATVVPVCSIAQTS